MNFSKSKTSPKRNQNARILIIEDNSDHMVLIKSAVQKCFTDIEVVMASDEQTAIHYLDECIQTGLRPPQFILLDLYLPERENGWQILKSIKNLNPEIGQIPIVVFSNSACHEDITESYDRGATSYVVKPTDFTEWVDYFQTLKDYWWETVTLPNHQSIY